MEVGAVAPFHVVTSGGGHGNLKSPMYRLMVLAGTKAEEMSMPMYSEVAARSRGVVWVEGVEEARAPSSPRGRVR